MSELVEKHLSERNKTLDSIWEEAGRFPIESINREKTDANPKVSWTRPIVEIKTALILI
jgi:hypothetical protein